MVNTDDTTDFEQSIDICLINHVFDNKLHNLYRDQSHCYRSSCLAAIFSNQIIVSRSLFVYLISFYTKIPRINLVYSDYIMQVNVQYDLDFEHNRRFVISETEIALIIGEFPDKTLFVPGRIMCSKQCYLLSSQRANSSEQSTENIRDQRLFCKLSD